MTEAIKHYKNISPFTRALITIAVMTATLMQVLDMTIVNVALPHMEGSLGATSDQITWVLTSYLVASAIFMPLTGYFTDRLGQKKYLLMSIAGFILASILCGVATSITQIVLFRILQGIFGASLVPLSQAILVDIFPPEERSYAMAIWGIGVMVGPILGPTLGGYLTDIASWRWNFYINVPIGLICLLLTWHILPETPKKQRGMDWLGLILISISIGALQFFLDRGNHDDWFSSREICISGFLAVTCFLGFLLHNTGRKHKNIVFDLGIFLDRNFAICSLLLMLFGVGMFGGMVILPLMLEKLFDYPVITTGLVMAPRGLSGMLGMLLVAKLSKTWDARIIIIIGVILCSGAMSVGTYYNLSTSPFWFVIPIILQGFGMGMIFVPLSTVAFSTLNINARSEAAGLFSLVRTMGGSVGISVAITLFTRSTQSAWNHLAQFVTPYNSAVPHYLRSLHTGLMFDPSNKIAVAVLTKTVGQQSQMMAFIDVYAFITYSFLVMLPFVFLLKKPIHHVEASFGE